MHEQIISELVKLKCGAEEAMPLVALTVMELDRLLKDAPMALFELATMARDREHEPFGNAGDILVERGFLSWDTNGTYAMHSSERHIVLSAIKGEGAGMCLVNPIEGK